MPEGATVLLLGAGASAASDHHLPTMTGFFAEETLRQQGFSDLDRFLRTYYGPNPRWDEVNLEDVMTHLYYISAGTYPVAAIRSTGLSRAREELDDYMYKCLVLDPHERSAGQSAVVIPQNAFKCDLHGKVFHKLDWSASRDSILTLNYDLITDATLSCMHDGQGGIAVANVGVLMQNTAGLIGNILHRDMQPLTVSPSEREYGCYVKLHGSVDWYCCPDSSCPNHHHFHQAPCPGRQIVRQDKVRILEQEFCRLCGAMLSRAMIPPILGKSRADFPKIGALWSVAFWKLRNASMWVIWGVSLAESDSALRGLLREAAQEAKEIRLQAPAIAVINPCQQAVERVETIARTQAAWFRSAEDWLEKRPAPRP